MTFLDKVVYWIREVLAFGSPDFVAGAWLPVFAVVLFIGAMLAVRKLLPLAGRGGAALLTGVSTALGAMLLVPDLLLASAWRRTGGRPPALLYHYGDAVAATTAGLTRTSGAVATGLTRMAKMHWVLVLLLCGGLVWTWNHSHCPATASARTACVRPFTGWLNSFGDDKTPPPPAHTTKPKPKAGTVPAKKS